MYEKYELTVDEAWVVFCILDCINRMFFYDE